MTKTFNISVVAPVCKEEGNVAEFLRRIAGILATITERYEVIFCLDPSPDRTEEAVTRRTRVGVATTRWCVSSS